MDRLASELTVRKRVEESIDARRERRAEINAATKVSLSQSGKIFKFSVGKR